MRRRWASAAPRACPARVQASSTRKQPTFGATLRRSGPWEPPRWAAALGGRTRSRAQQPPAAASCASCCRHTAAACTAHANRLPPPLPARHPAVRRSGLCWGCLRSTQTWSWCWCLTRMSRSFGTRCLTLRPAPPPTSSSAPTASACRWAPGAIEGRQGGWGGTWPLGGRLPAGSGHRALQQGLSFGLAGGAPCCPSAPLQTEEEWRPKHHQPRCGHIPDNGS